MSAISDLIAQAKLPEHVERLSLRGDLAAEHELLDAELTELQRKRAGDDRLGTPADGREQELAERITAIEAEMKDTMVEFRFRGINRTTKNRILLECPPRPGNKADEQLGANSDTWYAAMVRASLVSPAVESDEEFDQLVEVLSDGQFSQLTSAAIVVSGSTGTAVPFSRAASATTRRSSGTSE